MPEKSGSVVSPFLDTAVATSPTSEPLMATGFPGKISLAASSGSFAKHSQASSSSDNLLRDVFRLTSNQFDVKLDCSHSYGK